MNDISTIRYVIIIIFGQDTINYRNNKSQKCKQEYEYMVVEKKGFDALIFLNMFLFYLLLLKHRLCNISLRARSL